jgi:hypothetical protein
MAKRRIIGAIIDAEGKRYPIQLFTARQKKAALRKYTHELGYLAVAWNQLHHNLSAIFAVLLKSQDKFAAQAIWHSSDSDFAQRKMLRALLELDGKILHQLRMPLPKKRRDEILWLLNQIDESLRHKRNNALHAPLMMVRGVAGGTVQTRFEAHLNPQNPRARPLRGKNLQEEYRSYAQTAETLSDYANRIWFALTNASVPWPDRPRPPQARKKTQKRRPVSDPRP